MDAESIARSLGGKKSGKGWKAKCPAHEDKTPSLSIDEKGGRTLVHCHAGCPQLAVLDALRDLGLWEANPPHTVGNGRELDHAKMVLDVAEGQKESGESTKWSEKDLLTIQEAKETLGKPITLSEVTPKPVKWLWRDRLLMGALNIWSGDPGASKSLLTLWLAKTISLGDEFPCGTGLAALGDVFLLQAEDDIASTVVPRLIALGANRDRIHAFGQILIQDREGRAVDRMYSLKTDLERLSEHIASNDDARLLIIDPINSYIGGDTDTYKDNQVRSVLAPLSDMAQKLNIAILGIMHNRKGSGGKAVHASLGSIGYQGLARVTCMVATDRDNPERRIFVPAKSNVGRVNGNGLAYSIETRLVRGEDWAEYYPIVEWEQNLVNITADDLLADRPVPSKVKGAEAFLSEFLANGSRAANQVREEARKANVSSRTLERAKKNLGIQSARDEFGGSSKWQMPD
jgi:putative DNA primase/helicase